MRARSPERDTLTAAGAVDALAALAEDLVLLRGRSIADVQRVVADATRFLRDHAERAERPSPGGRPSKARPEVLRGEHDRFRESADQLQWFLRRVEEEDHGGNRQALGQYARVVVEAVRRHLGDERPEDTG